MTQLSIFEGEHLKQLGISTIEQTDRAFVIIMRGIAKRISQESGHVTTDNLRVVADKMGWQPKHPNSWGSCIKGKGWTILGYQKSAIPSNHARPIAIWRWKG